MSTVLTHIVVPLAAGAGLGHRIIPPRLLLLGCLFAVLPDVDVIGFYLGISYYSPFGHRGFTHSVPFAVFAGILAATAHRWMGARKLNTILFLSFSMVSHGVLDALTNGGLGIGFAWPFTNERYFLPWRELPVPSMGIRYLLGNWNIYVLKMEIYRVWIPMALIFVGLRVLRYGYFKR